MTFPTRIWQKVKGLARLRQRAATAGAPRRRRCACVPGIAVMPPRLLAIGSSTGGPQALFTLVQALGQALSVPVVLTQHMPATFTPILAEHITRLGGHALRRGEGWRSIAAGPHLPGTRRPAFADRTRSRGGLQRA